MSSIQQGCAIRDHRRRGEPVLYGRIICLMTSDDLVWVSLIPGRNGFGHQKNYVRAPLRLSLASLQGQIDRGDLSIAEFETPHHWLWMSSSHQENSCDGTGTADRRNIKKWIQLAEKSYARIKPFVHNRSIEEVLLDPKLPGWSKQRSLELGLRGHSQVQRALNAYLLGMGLRGSLLPWYIRCGAPGKPKFSKVKTGRPNEAGRIKGSAYAGINCTQGTRTILALGWKKFKQPGVSDREALNRTLHSFMAESVRWNGATAEVTLLPEAKFITVESFRYWGKKQPGALTSTQITNGETPAKRAYIRRLNNLKGRFHTINGEAFIDSTSTDQTLVSCASRLKVISAPWRTEVMGAAVNYIFGQYVGFEAPSATTSLLSILNAASSKVAHCAQFGIDIEERDWYSMTFKSFLADNGEAKGALAMQTLEDMEAGARFGKVYDAINKAPLESGHRRTQTQLDHLLPGSTMGQRKRRGEPDRSEFARLNYFEYMPRLIERVLHHNNTEIITLPTIEMRRDGVEPTRRGVLEWMLRNGYITSAPTDLQALRVRCLPRIQGSMQVDGLHLFDPCAEGRRLIPQLVYRSDWLLRSGLLAQAERKRWLIDVHLNPSDLSQVWVNIKGLKSLELVTPDAELRQISLLDWLLICRDDRLVGFLGRTAVIEHHANRLEAVNKTTQAASRQRKAEISASGTRPSKTTIKANRRDNTAEEASAHTGMPRPVERKQPRASAFTALPTASPAMEAGTPSASSDELREVATKLYEE